MPPPPHGWANRDPVNTPDHLANERTFLAWVRTSIALLGFGVLIAKLRLTGNGPSAGSHSVWLGLAFAVGGVLTLALSAWHYGRTRQMIESGNFHPATNLVLGFGVIVLGLGLSSVAYLLTILR